MKKVCIQMTDDGVVTVGIEPAAQDMETPLDAEGTKSMPYRGSSMPDMGSGMPDMGKGMPGVEGSDAAALYSEDEEDTEASYMKPARDVDDALRQAKQLLEMPQSTDGGPSIFEMGFANARGGSGGL